VTAERGRAIALIGVGLLLALAAVGPLPPPGGEPGASLTIRLPEVVWGVVVALFGLSVAILLAIQRRRRPAGDPAVPAKARQRLPAWLAATVSALAVISPVALWYLVTRYWANGEGHPIDRAMTAIADFLDFLAHTRKTPTSIPFLDATVGALLVLLAAAVFALMVVVALSDHLIAWRTARAPVPAPSVPEDGSPPPPDLRAEPDARAAVIRAYARFEAALAAVRAPRAPWQTPAEFARAIAARKLPVPPGPAGRLTSLFELARFSDRPLGPDARDAACDSLDEIAAALAEDAARAG